MTENLKRGENIALFKILPDLTEIIVAIKWLKKSTVETDFDIKSSVFLLSKNNKMRNNADFIFYNQPVSPDHAIIFKNEMFKVSLNQISQEIHKISFVLTL